MASYKDWRLALVYGWLRVVASISDRAFWHAVRGFRSLRRTHYAPGGAILRFNLASRLRL